jgi:tetratricopeptide (TPR) repeat protein
LRYPTFDQDVRKAAKLGLNETLESATASRDQLLKYASLPDISRMQRRNVQLQLAQAHQRLGDHPEALKVLGSIDLQGWTDSDFAEGVAYFSAISHAALRDAPATNQNLSILLDRWNNNPNPNGAQKRFRGFQCIEIGKICCIFDQSDTARFYWEMAERLLVDAEELEHVQRARSNLALLDLKSNNAEKEAAGLRALESLTNDKLRIGDLKGASTNYCNLGLYYASKKRFERAIAYHRRDLQLSLSIGDDRETAASLGNLAMLYVDLKQFSQARERLREAKSIAEELGDQALLDLTAQQLERINEMGREAGQQNIALGDKAVCACQSGKNYVDCCGRADFEPVDIPHIYGGISEDVETVRTKLAIPEGIRVHPLDIFLRSTEQVSQRRAWSEVGVHDGWLSMKEMPDMANLHLTAAKALLQSTGSAGFANYLSAVLLSVCYLEAFINQLSYFLYEHRTDIELLRFPLPAPLEQSGFLDYQRNTSLVDKWIQLSASLLGAGWLEKSKNWPEVANLIYVRNELVHFKAAGYEQVVPPSKKKDLLTIYAKIPDRIPIDDTPHSWPFRIITASVAKWAVEISETMVQEVKNGHMQSRRPTP